MENSNLWQDIQSSLEKFIHKSFNLGTEQMGTSVLLLVQKEMVTNETAAVTLEELERCIKKASLLLTKTEV